MTEVFKHDKKYMVMGSKAGGPLSHLIFIEHPDDEEGDLEDFKGACAALGQFISDMGQHIITETRIQGRRAIVIYSGEGINWDQEIEPTGYGTI